MGDESEIAELRRRVALLEQDADGERNVNRTMFRKLNQIEDALTDLTKAAAEVAKGFGRLETFVTISNAEMPRKVAEIVSLTMREERATLDKKLAALRADLAEDAAKRDAALRADLPKIIAEAVGAVLREQRK